ncbi:MAG: 3-phosphoglycerate dehydrogenase [Clostridiales Family XIII bacterium]|jgi:D-3-phosphoglycerate dehydrogenase|nr:3-phosphoglycerate dehydrogenase [Clostridiales Family XIII bacterium]
MYKIATLNKISPKGTGLLTDRYELTDDAGSAAAILVRSADMHEMAFADGLLAIARAGAGVNNIPLEKCADQGIVVFNTPGANANAVKELVLAGMLLASRNIPAALDWAKTLTEDAAKAVEKGKARFAGEEIAGKTLGVVGLGFIGVMVANTAEALGMKVAGFDPFLSLKAAHDLSASVKLYDKLPAMLPHCDYVTIHVPANSDTNGMFDYAMIDAMKNKGVLLNFSRDKLVVSEDLKRALAGKKLRCYVTDFPTDEMLGVEGVILIPHLGASTEESEENCAIMAVEEIMDFLENGNIFNAVNYPTVEAGKWAQGPRIVVLHKNIPSMLGTQTSALAGMGVNISNMVNKSKGDYSCTILDCDEDVDEAAVKEAFAVDGIISVRVITKRG